MLNNDGFCQLFNTSPPPFPLCHYVIISSTPSLPLSSPFTEQAHNKTHSVTLCIFTPSLLALDEMAPPHPQRAPLGAFFDAGWHRTCSLIDRFIMLSKGGSSAALSRSAGGGIGGSGCCVQAAACQGFHSGREASLSEQFQISALPALLT